MRLGARWLMGEAPHHAVPTEIHGVIAEQERSHPEAKAWTLTWLEGRPRCQLDDLLIVTLDGVIEDALSTDVEDDDDWLS